MNRNDGIGASESPAVCGLSPWQTALEVYCRKRQLVPEPAPTQAMLWGLRLEPVIADAYEYATGQRLETVPTCIRHPQHDWLFASPDRVTESGDRLVELKSVNAFAADEWGEPGSDAVPEYVLVQVEHQLAVVEGHLADVAVLIGGSDFRIYTVARNQPIIARIVEITGDFWHNHVVPAVPPPPDWKHQSTPDLVQAMYPPTETAIDLGADAAELVERYEDAGVHGKTFQTFRDVAKAKLIALMGQAGRGNLPDGRCILRRELSRRGYSVEPSSYIDFRIQNRKKVKV